MINRRVLLVLSPLLIQCSPSRQGSQPLDQPQIGEPETTRAEKVCFPGQNGQPACLHQLVATPLPVQMNLYKYPNPLTDPDFPKDFDIAQYQVPDRFLDLQQIAPDLFLSEHFSRRELMLEGPSRGYYGIFNPRALRQIELLRAKIGRALIITGGFRSPGRNAQLEKAAKFSRHTYGDGIDFRVEGMTYKQLVDICYQFGAGFALPYTDHIHCDWRNTPLDSAFFPPADLPSTQPSNRMILQSVRSTARIQRDGATLSIAMFKDDPEGEPYVEWTVVTPKGERLTSAQPTFTLPDERGIYQVQADVGLSFRIESLMEVLF